MKNKEFMELDSLDKFLNIYMKILNNSIDTSKDKMFKNIYESEKSCILSIVKFIRHIEKLSDEELIKELKDFEKDPNIKDFVVQITSTMTSKIDMKKIRTEKSNRYMKDTKNPLLK